MSWGAAIAVGGSLVSGAIGSSSARRAAREQAAAQREALAEQRRQFDIGQANQQPFRIAGTNAVNELANYRFQAPDAGQVEREPGYAFGLQQGRNALEGSAAARGGLFSGNALKALTRYGNDYGTTKFNDAFERARSTYSTNANTLGNLVNAGTGAATQMQNAGANFANNNANMLNSGAQYQGAAGIAGANAWGNAINQGISIGNRNNWWQRGGSGGGGSVPMSPGSGYGELGEQYFADGGPVLVEVAPGRYEPKVGTRSKRPSAGGGGALGNDNVLRALAAEGSASAPAAPRYRTMRDLQVEQALKDAGAYADGGPVMVPDGGGRMVPQIGMRTPRPGAGTGGGMSREAVLQALTAAQAASAPAARREGLAGLTANPVTNPQGVTEQRLKDAGAYRNGGMVRDYDSGGMVHGPGGPRDDAIPAHLSNGEHVMDAASVTALGRGSNARGQKKLNALRAVLKGA
jgi:hypothetical protein